MHFRAPLLAGGLLSLLLLFPAESQAQCRGNRSGGGGGTGRGMSPGSPPGTGTSVQTNQARLTQMRQMQTAMLQQTRLQQQRIQQYQQYLMSKMATQSGANLSWYATRSQDQYVRWAASMELSRRRQQNQLAQRNGSQ